MNFSSRLQLLSIAVDLSLEDQAALTVADRSIPNGSNLTGQGQAIAPNWRPACAVTGRQALETAEKVLTGKGPIHRGQ